MTARPICAVCAVPVESLSEDRDAWEGVVWTARCHGEVERVVLSEEELRTVSRIEFVQAFADSPRRLRA